eukprot:2966084-Pleurochrysis_carterae.AAC.1
MNVNWVTAFKHGKATRLNARPCEGVDAGKQQKQKLDRGGGSSRLSLDLKGSGGKERSAQLGLDQHLLLDLVELAARPKLLGAHGRR